MICPRCGHPLTCEWHPVAGECSNTPRTEQAARLVAEHIEPVAVLRSVGPELCPYCLIAPALPCALHRPKDRP